MTPKPHILRDWIRGQRRVKKAGTAAAIYLMAPYNNSHLRTIPQHKRYQFI